SAELVASWPKPGWRNRVGNDDGTVVASELQVIAECNKRHVSAVGDETQPEFPGKRQRALDDVVVPVHQYRTSVPDVREHRESRVDGSAQVVQRRIRVTGRDDNAA